MRKCVSKGFLVIIFLVANGCRPTEFSGDNGTQRQPLKKNSQNGSPIPGPSPSPYPTPGPTPGPTPSPQCDPASFVLDPNASQVIGGRQDLVNLVNSVCGAKLSNNFYGAGALLNDQSTADVLCRFKGFLKGVITKTGTYYSPKDNFVGQWTGSAPNLMGPFDPLSGQLVVSSAADSSGKSKSLIDGLTCTGSVQPACVPKAQSISCR